jgi:hypothetical protein
VKNKWGYIGSLLVVVLGVGLGYLSRPKLAECANLGNCGELPVVAINNGESGIFAGREIEVPEIDLQDEQLVTRVLGEEVTTGEKQIYVDLEKQMLTAYDGETIYLETPISTGKWGRTPPGEYTIWVKMRATRMEGGTGADYYNLPNVPYVMFFSNEKVPKIAGYSLHGAYWHNNFGHAMSHGCVNMRQIDAQKLYEWVTPITTGTVTYTDAENTGTKVTIF